MPAPFDRFRSEFRHELQNGGEVQPWSDQRLVEIRGYEGFVSWAAGGWFDRGLYRLHTASTGLDGQAQADGAFPELRGRLSVFAYDWLGRQFALDFGRLEQGQPLVTMLDPGAGEALRIPSTFVEFHDEEIIDYRDAALACDFFTKWSVANEASLPLGATQCVGYRVPLFLGGRDQLDNLELSDFDVYWTICGQLRVKTFDLPLGTPVDGITLEGS